MKLSVIHPILNSHEVVRRQVLHYERMHMPEGVEVLFVDDGSEPPLRSLALPPLPFLRILETGDTRAWTWPIARNMGAREAQGEYLLFADIDYIIPEAAIRDALGLTEDRMNFRREFGILDQDGVLTQDLDVLRSYGLLESRIRDKGVAVSAHTNTFVMRKETFWRLGGYRTDRIGKPYPQREDGDFDREWLRRFQRGEFSRTYHRPLVLMFPNGKFCGDADYNPMGLFHSLSRK